LLKILVTGACGYIGSHLCERLIDLGHKVTGIDCFTDYYDINQKKLNQADIESKGVVLYRADLSKDDLFNAVKDANVVYHLAAQPGISAKTPFELYEKNNIIATHKLLESIKNNPPKMFVNVSTSSVYGLNADKPETFPGEPASYYGVTKLAAEQLVLSYWREGYIKACSIRLFSIYGPRERPEKLFPQLIKAILRDQIFPLYEGSRSHIRSYTYVRDAIDGLVSILKCLDKVNGEIFNIGTDKTITTGDAIKIVENILNKKAKFEIKPRRPGDQFKTQAVIEKARSILGYIPQIAPEEGLKETVKWYQKNLEKLS